ncbi:aldo/keto reductase [Nitzschia inconspicua]|uniref:Aldo/keto reductase n=1 Tax=Nitzschia inconspicua TaxID=303405 RepID=A0A9K3LA36_9STRA|nr:aldo/keto reductase [Nitzschia inconspicua]
MADSSLQPSDPKRLKISGIDLVDLAKNCVGRHPDSDIEIALAFVKETVPQFAKESNDRLVKVGRNVKSLVRNDADPDGIVLPIHAALELQVQECHLLSESASLKVPKVRFGKTNIEMPIITLGCMRFQQRWGDTVQTMNQVYSDCQDNLVAILRRAILDFGINHIETARGYGCSELQLGCAFQQLFATGEIKREDLILQTKVGPREDPNEFRKLMEQSFKALQVDYIDLFAFHGLNGDWQWEWMFGDKHKENCWSIIQEYKAAGKIKFIGFSTHGPTDLINKLIETDKFDYANVHHHFCGSYTASGDGPDHMGNISCLRKMKERDMGAFIISPCDKGGKIYEPSQKLRSLTLPDCEPMAFGLAWLWNLHRHDPHQAEAHTLTIGAARPSDLDQLAVAAHLQGKDEMFPKVVTVSKRLQQAQVDALGQDWLDSCYDGTIKAKDSLYMVEHNQLIWMYNCIKAWGMLAFAKDRYNTFVNNTKNYDPSLTHDENIDKIGRGGWGFTPGVVPQAGKDYFVDDLAGIPEKNRSRVKEAYDFVMKLCGPMPAGKEESKSACEEGAAPGPEKPKTPVAYQTSYELKPWKDYPDRHYPY